MLLLRAARCSAQQPDHSVVVCQAALRLQEQPASLSAAEMARFPKPF